MGLPTPDSGLPPPHLHTGLRKGPLGLPSLVGRLLRAVFLAGLVLAALWGTLAIYYSNLPWAWARLALALVFAAFSFWALFRAKQRWAWPLFGLLFLAVLIWEILIPPSNDRIWRADVAVLPRAFIDGDRVRLTGVRDFSFRSSEDFTPKHVEREVQLSQLSSVDLLISYWGTDDGPVAHTFLSFNFDNAAPVSISIEARPEAHEGYNPIASIFKQFELIYVVGEERDLVGARVGHRREAVFLYPVRTSQEGARRLFLVYMQRLNELADEPEWYSLLKSNCTLNVIRYARASGWESSRFNIRHYLNGWVDRYLFATGILGTGLPFRELRAQARVHEQLRPGELSADFSRRIRAMTAPDPGAPAAPAAR